VQSGALGTQKRRRARPRLSAGDSSLLVDRAASRRLPAESASGSAKGRIPDRPSPESFRRPIGRRSDGQAFGTFASGRDSSFLAYQAASRQLPSERIPDGQNPRRSDRGRKTSPERRRLAWDPPVGGSSSPVAPGGELPPRRCQKLAKPPEVGRLRIDRPRTRTGRTSLERGGARSARASTRRKKTRSNGRRSSNEP